jgi:hypothetical protein
MNCCNANCAQGRACPVRQACELPADDIDPTKPNVLASAAKYALILIAFGVICASPFLSRWMT